MAKTKSSPSRVTKKTGRSKLLRNLQQRKLQALLQPTGHEINKNVSAANFDNPEPGCAEILSDAGIHNNPDSVLADDLPPLEFEKDMAPQPSLSDIIKGRRIVNLSHILKEYEKIAIHSYVCTMGKMKPVKETRVGFQSLLKFHCDNCDKSITISTDPSNNRGKEINNAVVWASLSIGVGQSLAEEFCGVLDIPCISHKTFLKHTSQIRKMWQEYLFSQMREAGNEERKIALERGDVTENGIPYITVIGDGGWSKRSYGHGYNASSGVGIIIGAATKKPLFLGVRNKICSICCYYKQKDVTPREHECAMNFKGTSTAMEHDIITEGFAASIEQHGLIYKYYIGMCDTQHEQIVSISTTCSVIGDGDSNVYSKIIEKVPYGRQVIKIECANHMTRNVNEKLHKLSLNTTFPLQCRKMLSSKENGISRIERLVKGIRTAIKEHQHDSQSLRLDLKNAPYHIFGQHENCRTTFCTRKERGEENLVGIMESSGIFTEIRKIIEPMIMKADRLAFNETTNQAERFMSLVAKFTGGKRVNFSKSISYGARASGAALSHAMGPSWHISSWRATHKAELGDNGRAVFLRRQRILARRKERFRTQKKWKRKITCGPDEHYGPNAGKEDMCTDQLQNAIETLLNTQRERVDTTEKWSNIENVTRGQHANPTWREIRSNILTASNFGSVIKRRATTSCHNLIKRLLYGKDVNTKGILYGRMNEDRAKLKYEEHSQNRVTKCGLFIDPTHPYLGASPDGLIGDDGVLEIKCFPSLGEEKFTDTKRKNLCFENVDGKIRLKRNHSYYYQIQGQMNISRRNFCDLVYFSENDFHIERMSIDKQLWEEKMLPKLKSFYYECMAPEIVDGRIPRGLRARDAQSTVDE